MFTLTESRDAESSAIQAWGMDPVTRGLEESSMVPTFVRDDQLEGRGPVKLLPLQIDKGKTFIKRSRDKRDA